MQLYEFNDIQLEYMAAGVATMFALGNNLDTGKSHDDSDHYCNFSCLKIGNDTSRSG